MSAVKANSPLPKDNGDSEFNWCRVGLCLSTRALRLISAAALAREPAKRLAPRANAAAPMAVARKSLRETLISATVRTPLACQFLTGRLERKRPRLHSRATNLTNKRGRLRSRLCGQRPGFSAARQWRAYRCAIASALKPSRAEAIDHASRPCAAAGPDKTSFELRDPLRLPHWLCWFQCRHP